MKIEQHQQENHEVDKFIQWTPHPQHPPKKKKKKKHYPTWWQAPPTCTTKGNRNNTARKPGNVDKRGQASNCLAKLRLYIRKVGHGE